MKRLVIYDSVYGNTAEVARALASALDDAEAKAVEEIDPASLGGLSLLVVGSPTQGGRPTPKIKSFLAALPPHALHGTAVAAFDTRLAFEGHGIFLRTLMRFVGFAAPRIGRRLKAAGGELLTGPEGFIVEGREGPLRTGEIERAAAWARTRLQEQRQPVP